MAGRRDDQFAQMSERYAGYQVYDRHYEKVGKVDDLFVDESDRLEYIGVKMGFLGARSTLIPMDIVRVNDERRLMEVDSEIGVIKEGPSFDSDREITPRLEEQVHAHFGLKREGSSVGRGGYGAYDDDYRDSTRERSRVDLEYGERAESGVPEFGGHSGADAGRERELGRSTGDRSGDTEPDMTTRNRESGESRERDEEHPPDATGRGYADEGRREDRDAYYRDTGREREEDRAGGSGRAGEERRERHREDLDEVGSGMAAGGRASGGARSGSDTSSYRGGGSSEDSADREAHASRTGHAGEERRERYREEPGAVGAGMSTGDTETGEFRGHASEQEGVHQPGSDLEDEDELRVQRSEEELRVGTREREAGSVNVRKRVRTDRERIRVPKRREEVTVERVPVEGREASEAEIGADEVRMPVVEEEVVVEKRPVVKEELRIRKDVVEDEEVVEEDVRKEEVDVIDETTRRGDAGGSTERRDR